MVMWVGGSVGGWSDKAHFQCFPDQSSVTPFTSISIDSDILFYLHIFCLFRAQIMWYIFNLAKISETFFSLFCRHKVFRVIPENEEELRFLADFLADNEQKVRVLSYFSNIEKRPRLMNFFDWNDLVGDFPAWNLCSTNAVRMIFVAKILV